MFDSERLNETHEVEEFDSGNTWLDSWLHTFARRADSTGIARTYVWTAPGERRVVAYYALCPTEVDRAADGVPSSIAGGVSRIPGYLLARLAVSRDHQGCGLGGQLFLDALEKAVEASEISGGRVIVVDAIDDAACEFYRRYGFVPVRGRPRRLVMKTATAARALCGE